MFQGSQQALVDIHLRQTEPLSGLVVFGKACALLTGVSQLVIAIGKLKTGKVDLEA